MNYSLSTIIASLLLGISVIMFPVTQIDTCLKDTITIATCTTYNK